MSFLKNKTILNSTIGLSTSESENNSTSSPVTSQVECDAAVKQPYVPNWQWIDGYKYTDMKMQGYNNFQYELNKQYDMPEDSEIKLCLSGFHFCKELSHIFANKRPCDIRFFKVKALVDVNSDYYKKYGIAIVKDTYCGMDIYETLYKMVAKSIILLEEIETKDTYDAFCQFKQLYKKDKSCYGAYSLDCIDDVDSYLIFYRTGNIKDIYVFKTKQLMMEKGFSEPFSALFNIDNHVHYNDFSKYLNGLCAENLSKDMLVYLLLNKLHGYPVKR